MPPRYRPIAPPASPPSLSYLDRLRWVEVLNQNAEDAPGGALLRVTGTSTGADVDGTGETDDYGVPSVDRPDADGLDGLLVAHPAGIPAGGRGLATPSDFVPVAYDAAGTPAIGDTWGSAAGSWRLTAGKAGWRVAAGPIESQDLRLVEAWRTPCRDDSGSSGSSPNRIRVVTDLCENTSGSGPAFIVRKAELYLGDGYVTDEWCEGLGECGSGVNGGLCDDLPDQGTDPPDPPPDVPTVDTDCGTLPETMYGFFTIDGCATEFTSEPLVYVGASNAWEAPSNAQNITECCSEEPSALAFTVSCVEGVLNYTVGTVDNGFTPTSPPTVSSDPWMVELTGTFFCNGVDTPATLTFTETAP